MNILHITAHLGGGVGNILTGVCNLDKLNTHKILCMEKTINTHFFDIAVKNATEIFFYDNKNAKQYLDWADIVQVEWWHNPLVAQFMVKELSKAETRLVVWSHISGCNYPRTPIEFIKSTDAFAFTSHFSYENPSFDQKEVSFVKANCSVIPSSANSFDEIGKRTEHHTFNVGYIGFLGYNKLSPKFIKYCEAIGKMPNIRFIIVGDLNYAQELLGDIESSTIKEQFIVKGYSKDVASELACMDVFGYPLYFDHTGTTENTLLEAMAAGVVPIVLNQCSEKYVVENGKTGFCVDSIEQYAQVIAGLYNDKQQLEEMSYNCSKYVKENYSVYNTVKKLQETYSRQMEKPKRTHELEKVFGKTPYDWFLSCYKGDLHRIDGLAISKTKGSLVQFASCFPQDKKLETLLKENFNGTN